MASLAKENVRYFVGRENLETKQQQVIHDNIYTDLNGAYEDFNQSTGYKEVSTANREAARLNASEADKAADKGRKIKWHYFTFRKDDKVTTLSNYVIPAQPVEPTEPPQEDETLLTE